jgi:hypothetical protein
MFEAVTQTPVPSFVFVLLKYIIFVTSVHICSSVIIMLHNSTTDDPINIEHWEIKHTDLRELR